MFTHSTEHNTYAMALVDAIAAHLRATTEHGHQEPEPTPINVPGGTWTLSCSGTLPRWTLTRHEGGDALEILRFTESIDAAAAVMLAFDELRPIELWPADADDLPIELWPTDVPRGTSSEARGAVASHA